MHAKPSARACLSCRNKHLRCDGGSPRCRRCTDLARDCMYIQSRRGFRKDSRRATRANVPTPIGQSSSVASLSISSDQTASGQSDIIQPHAVNEYSQPSSIEGTNFVPRSDNDRRSDDYLIEVYYQTIHPAHPFLFPYKLYQQDPLIFPEHLLSAMRYISSHYTSEDPEIHRTRVNAVYQADVPDDGFKVQVLLLLTLTCYARFEREMGYKALSTAIDVAMKINLNSDNYAQGQDRVFQESWRRTWWELFTMSSLISLVSGSNQRLSLPHNMILPTDDEGYEMCDISQVGTITDMQQRFFYDDIDPWSSFAYKIEAVRILNEAREFAAVPSTGDEMQAVKASISGFLLSIPEDKAEGLKETGEVDEVMSLSLMVIHLANISLHLERSELGSVRGLATACGNDSDRSKLVKSMRSSRTACLDSAKALANLITSRASLRTLSPCFSCAMAFAAIVQLAECRLERTSHARCFREQIKLQLSALKSLRNTWPIAGVVHRQLAQFCRDIFTAPSAMPNFNEIQPTIIEEQWMQDLLTEDLQVPFEDFLIQGTN